MAARTTPVLDEETIEVLRRMTPEARLLRSFELRDAEIALARARIIEAHPVANEREVKMRLFSLWHDAATMRRVWDWDPDLGAFGSGR